ncbi:GDSL esterase/lipase 5 [Apostasia shenzhenica]|uniref:GDSL esterase/lipase 5 n=1 Tax=Apostasia shenzhenica TaxID=1088818 RepID=A0A2I0AET8_9ASPA|nr:GDSL esterase/lipase 5 [Apostasia shenzhenica]
MASRFPAPPTAIFPILALNFLIISNSIASSSEKPTDDAAAAAFFIFGDSTVDPGNNNYIDTVPGNRADIPPYGQSGFASGPTGRFSNGRIIVDFVAMYAKIPVVPPFMNPSSRYRHGVNFGSGAAGVLPETNQGKVIDLRTQLKQFDKVVSSLSVELGDKEARILISNAVYCISIGSNDYLSGYLSSPEMQERFGPEEFVGMVIGNLSETIQELYLKGARKFIFPSLCPLGCLPALRAVNPKADGSCFEEVSSLALAHNKALSAVLISFNHIFKGFKYAFTSGFYSWFHELVHNPSQFGFKDGINACCGTGPYGGVYSCGGDKEVKDYTVCEKPEEFVWWDSFHGTEMSAQLISKTMWDGPPEWVAPYNLRQLFFETGKERIEDLVDEEDGVEPLAV